MIKIIKKSRYKDLLESEKNLKLLTTDPKTYEGKTKKLAILIAQVKRLQLDIKQIDKIAGNLRSSDRQTGNYRKNKSLRK